jgi:hypothetical protein
VPATLVTSVRPLPTGGLAFVTAATFQKATTKRKCCVNVSRPCVVYTPLLRVVDQNIGQVCLLKRVVGDTCRVMSCQVVDGSKCQEQVKSVGIGVRLLGRRAQCSYENLVVVERHQFIVIRYVLIFTLPFLFFNMNFELETRPLFAFII